MVNKELSLTFSIRNNPGVYALLLGSGVSTEAGVPTGWGIIEDLIRQIADTQDEDPEPDPFEWYKEQFEEKPEYDQLIGSIAPSKEERQALLEKYFEPTDEEREEGTKTPSNAHRAIAWLIDQGYVNVVVTTNFDQLLEQALSERGITPVVISSSSDAEGAAPLAHQDAVIVKVNGDYKKVNIKNITEELEEYDPVIEDLLDKVFDEYGLIVCGWSGDWDIALREALLRCESRKYSTYWAYHGELEESANELVAHRDGIPIQISGASDFFSEVKENVRALEGAESAAPLTREVARERVKRYLSRKEQKIDLADLLREEVNSVLAEVTDEDRFPLDVEVNDENLEERARIYENIVGTLTVASTTCAYWGPEVENSPNDSLSEAVRRLGSLDTPENTYQKVWRDFRMYPASFLLYAVSVAAVEAENWDLLHHLLDDTQVKAPGFTEKRAASILNPWTVGGAIGRRGDGNRFIRNRLKSNIRDHVREFIPDDSEYESQFYKTEALIDLSLADQLQEESRLDATHHIDTLYYNGIVDELGEELESDGEDWGPLRAGMFDGSVDRADMLIESMREKSRW